MATEKQYCRYCVHCAVTDFAGIYYCSANEEEMPRWKVYKANHCKQYDGPCYDVDSEDWNNPREYRPRQPGKKRKKLEYAGTLLGF